MQVGAASKLDQGELERGAILGNREVECLWANCSGRTVHTPRCNARFGRQWGRAPQRKHRPTSTHLCTPRCTPPGSDPCNLPRIDLRQLLAMNVLTHCPPHHFIRTIQLNTRGGSASRVNHLYIPRVLVDPFNIYPRFLLTQNKTAEPTIRYRAQAIDQKQQVRSQGQRLQRFVCECHGCRTLLGQWQLLAVEWDLLIEQFV